MESSNCKSTGKQPAAAACGRHHQPSANRELWAAVRNGTVHDVDVTLAALKKANGSVDARDRFGSSATHIATWRNHVPIVKRLLAAGANPDARDGESGWGSLHRALHFGHLAVAGALIDGGASLHLEDAKGRLPVDLVSGPLKTAIDATSSSDGVRLRELFGWGNGSNYQLGTGTAGIQRVPCRVEAFHGVDIVAISAAKFHSVAITSKGEVFSWGYGRGGRLGHEDYSGEVAVITPRQIRNVLGGRCVKTVAAAKHHTIVATEGGEVYTWGTNREGQLGYPSVDTQSTPRRVTALKAKVVAVAAANKHSAAVTEAGEVFTWGCNREGQLGYGISNSASNCVPRMVDYLKGKHAVAVSAAKYHTVALVSGEVFTWGYRMVSPRRVLLVRNTKKAGSVPLKFHQSQRLQILAIAAGVVHSTAITGDGLVFSWLSADSQLHAQQVLSVSAHQVVAVSAGKYRTAVVTATGDAYCWDSVAEAAAIGPPSRIHGIKRVLFLAVGETHSLAVTEIYVPLYDSPKTNNRLAAARHDAPSLRDLCQKVIAESVLEPRNSLQLLEYADSLDAADLKQHCERLILHNLDYMLAYYSPSFGTLRSSVLADLEKSWDACSSQAWSHRQLPVPSATVPPVVDSEEEDDNVNPRVLKGSAILPVSGFLRDDSAGVDNVSKHSRAIRKKLQQIKALEIRLSKGQTLDDQQLAKVRTKSILLLSLAKLEDSGESASLLLEESSDRQSFCDERSNRQGRKGKKRAAKESNMPASGSMVNQKAESAEVVSVAGPDVSAEASHDVALRVSTDSKAVEAVPRQHKAKCKKGGLSMFLAGELDKKAPPAPVKPVVVVPAWGGASRRVDAASLSDIQSQQRAESSHLKSSDCKRVEAGSASLSEGSSAQRIPLQRFVRSSGPSISTSPGLAASPKAAPWLGTSPGSVQSLKDIQMQEVKHKEQQQHRAALTLRATQSPVLGFTPGTPDSADLPSCWFKPESSSPSSIRCIQIEEKAMKDLRRLYKTVKILNS